MSRKLKTEAFRTTLRIKQRDVTESVNAVYFANGTLSPLEATLPLLLEVAGSIPRKGSQSQLLKHQKKRKKKFHFICVLT